MSALDRHITGNYGEDHLREVRKESRAFKNGARARAKGRPMTACPYPTSIPDKRHDWQAGWADEDACIQSQNIDPQEAAA